MLDETTNFSATLRASSAMADGVAFDYCVSPAAAEKSTRNRATLCAADFRLEPSRPIFRRFDTLPRRSVGVETLVRSPIMFGGTVGEGPGADFAELVSAIARPLTSTSSQNCRPRPYAFSK